MNFMGHDYANMLLLKAREQHLNEQAAYQRLLVEARQENERVRRGLRFNRRRVR